MEDGCSVGPTCRSLSTRGRAVSLRRVGGKGTPYLGRLLAGPRCGEGAQARAAGLRGGKGSWASGCWANRAEGEGVGLRGEGGVLSFLLFLFFYFLFFFQSHFKNKFENHFLKQFDFL